VGFFGVNSDVVHCFIVIIHLSVFCDLRRLSAVGACRLMIHCDNAVQFAVVCLLSGPVD